MEEPAQETEDEATEDRAFDPAVAPSRPVGRPKKKLPPLTPLEQNALVGNLPNIEMMLEVLQQSCILIKQKAQLERQLDTLQRQVHDTRIALEREQQRLGEARTIRMESARG